MILLGGCLSFSPDVLPSSRRDRNGESLAALQAAAPRERLRFAVVGDVQRGYDAASDAVRRLNGIDDLAFVVQVGDFTDQGLLAEYELMDEVFQALRVPLFVVIGNHDLLANGAAVYEAFFGRRDLAFTHDRTRFVLLDTNSREHGLGSGVPDLSWLSEQLAPDALHERAVVFSHVWPWSADFDPALEGPFRETLAAAGVALSFHGHDHSYRVAQDGPVQYVVADHVDNRTFLLVTAEPGRPFDVERVAF